MFEAGLDFDRESYVLQLHSFSLADAGIYKSSLTPKYTILVQLLKPLVNNKLVGQRGDILVISNE